MDDNVWWWAIYDDLSRDQCEIDSSYNYSEIVSSGKDARAIATNAARDYIGKHI